MLQRIIQHYNKANKAVSEADTKKEIAEILEKAAEAKPKPPRKPRTLHYYSHLYYQDRIRPTVEEEWRKKKMSRLSPELEDDTVALVDFRHKVTQRFWQNETKAFRDNVQKKLEEEHAARKKAFNDYIERVTKEDPESAEGYHSYALFP